MDCTTRNFDQIPKRLPKNLVGLNLQLNNISKVSKKSLVGCKHLRKLDLSGNGMAYIDPDTFSYTPTLKELHIHDNKLELNSSQSYDMFKPLKQSLEILSIQNNTARSDRIFENLIMLKYLTTEGRFDEDFGRGFLSLTRLTSLTLHYNSSNIINDTFVNFARSPIKEFRIVSSSLANLEPLSFSHFKSLELLDLSYTQKLTLVSASKSWYGLNSTNITTLILTRMDSSDEKDVRIEFEFFNYLENTKISKLLLNKNNIVELTGNISTRLPFLEHLDLSFNRITRISAFVNDIYRFQKLSYLDSSYQIRRYITKRQQKPKLTTFAGFAESGNISTFEHVGREEIKLDHSECVAAVFKTCEVKFSMRVDAQMATSIGSSRFSRNSWCQIAVKNLEVLNMSETIKININKLPPTLILGTTKLRHLEYKANGLKMVTGPVMVNRPRFSEPLTFDLRENGITCLAKNVLSYSVSKGLNVGGMNLAGNNLGEQLALDIEGGTFSEYRNLSELNLANNKIKTLPANIFRKTSHLKILNLSDNSLQLIEFDYSHFDRLETLDLSHNLFIQLEDSQQIRLTNIISQYGNFSLAIHGNPLQCSCESLDFLKWLKMCKANVVNYENTSCLYGKIVHKFQSIDDVLNNLDFECSKTLALKISGSICVLTILGFIFSIFLYRHRWDVRYYMLKMSHKGQNYQRLVDQSRNYLYDAFVAYDKDDTGWVRNELISHLESTMADGNEDHQFSRKHMRLCIHERDFEPGKCIEENIVTAIEQSKMVLVVISKNFLNSNWCRFELEMARMHGMERGNNIVIPILMEDVSFEEMPASLRMIVRKHTYIEWKEETGDHEEFWERLADVLSNVENNTFVCECGRVA